MGRFLLDSRDLIDVLEHSRPISAPNLARYLRECNDQIAVTFTNVRELCGPLAAGGDFLRVRDYLQSLERMPHTYLREVMILAVEIESAVRAFTAGIEPEPNSPYVSRWDYTLGVGQPSSPAENWVALRLDEIVYSIRRTRPDVFSPPTRHLENLRTILREDRERLRIGKAPARQHFIQAIKKHAATHGVTLPTGCENEFAAWVYENPSRCPGLRLLHETYRGLMANYEDVPEAADFSDMAHVSAVPYVDVATLDRRMRHYCSMAARKMLRFGTVHNYAQRLYGGVAALMAR